MTTTKQSTTRKNKSWVCDTTFFKQCIDAVKAREVKAKFQQAVNSWSMYNGNW